MKRAIFDVQQLRLCAAVEYKILYFVACGCNVPAQ